MEDGESKVLKRGLLMPMVIRASNPQLCQICPFGILKYQWVLLSYAVLYSSTIVDQAIRVLVHCIVIESLQHSKS